jgi:hypothetical protein
MAGRRRSEEKTNWEGAYRVPCLARWPGKIRPGTVSNEIIGHHDWLPTFVAAAGMPDVRSGCSPAMRSGLGPSRPTSMATICLPYLTGQETTSPRKVFSTFPITVT